MLLDEKDFSKFLEALRFASEKHINQRRKDKRSSPYINHPVKVSELLWNTGGVRDINIIIAGLLHDTVEDTDTTADEIRKLFGNEVALYVSEVSDDKNLKAGERKRLQILHAPHVSKEAKLVKLADKICNVYDILYSPPYNWSLERRLEYLDWTEKVVAGLKGSNPMLEELYAQTLKEAREKLTSILI